MSLDGNEGNIFAEVNCKYTRGFEKRQGSMFGGPYNGDYSMLDFHANTFEAPQGPPLLLLLGALYEGSP